METNLKRCEICGSDEMIQSHHKYARYKSRAKRYPEIDNKINIQTLCWHCHLQKVKGVIIWDEIDFVRAMKLEKPRSKVGLIIWDRINN